MVAIVPHPQQLRLTQDIHFLGWTKNGGSTYYTTAQVDANDDQFDDTTFTAVFEEDLKFSVANHNTPNDGAGKQSRLYQSVTYNGDTVTLDGGDSHEFTYDATAGDVELEYVADAGYQFIDCEINNSGGGSDPHKADNPRYISPASYAGGTGSTDTIDLQPQWATGIDFTVTGGTYVYNGTSRTVSVNGTETGDTITYSTDGVNYSATEPSITDVGSITVYVKVARTGYITTVKSGTVTITKRAVTLTADDDSKTYGDADPASFTASVTAGSVVSGETLDYTVDRTAGENVGTYDIVVTEGTNPNYDITVAKGTFTITKRAVTLTADDDSKTYGDADPTSFTASVTAGSVVSGETLDYTVDRTAGENVGTYDIIVTEGTNPNYNVTVVKGTFTINQKSDHVESKQREQSVWHIGSDIHGKSCIRYSCQR